MPKINIYHIDSEGPNHRDKEEKIEQTDKLLKKLNRLQAIFNAQKKYAMLVVLQGLDASGKDGVCKKVFGGLNPLNIDFMSWKAPTSFEKDHDYLWRIHYKLPQKGFIQVFNRSYYEDILVPTVLKTHDKETIKKRYDHINWFERYMRDNGIILVKCYFSVSEKVQKERMEERLQNPEKYRKHNDNDRETLEMRDKYLDVYQDILNTCDDPKWHFVPADHNRQKNYVVTKILYEELKQLDLERPGLDTTWTLEEYLDKIENVDDIKEFRAKFESEGEPKEDIKQGGKKGKKK
ncbi:MAG TPA: hypothetical protein PLW93_02800 [Candidatus Absconditabacterales bacterium]|nr:hypothetical protein [Candidatus Absconditabacterales bacterium]HNG97179.1 hypothetical protein [Candidatus Absconditabacterales bacterium]